MKITCNCCGVTKCTEEDIPDTQEWLVYHDCGGYSSHIGDGLRWRLILCQECTQTLVGEFIEVEDETNP